MTKKQTDGIAPPSTPPTSLKLHPKRNVKGVSFKIICKKEKLNKAGLAPLALQYFIAGRKTEIGLKLSIPLKYWNSSRQQIDNPADENYEHYNLLIEQFRNEFNSGLIGLAIEKISPTRELIKNRLENKNSNEDFIKFFEKKYLDRWNNNQIDDGTYRHHKTVFSKLKKFKNIWLFSEIDSLFLKNFNTWHLHYLKLNSGIGKNKNGKILINGGHNTAQKTLAVIKTYLNLAIEAKIKFLMPHLKISYINTSRDFCTESELKILIDMYNSDYLQHDQLAVSALEKFLFSCATGLRISDIQRISIHHIKDGFLSFIPHKGRQRKKEINIPILGFIEKIMIGKTNKIFGIFSEQPVNRKLKEIAATAGIAKNLSMNVGRHTFATLFLQNGGDIKSLQDILGHGNIRTTQNYLHKDLGHLKKQMENSLSAIFNKKT